MATEQEKTLFEALVRQTADSLQLYLAACTRDAALADDVFQDTLVVAWRRLSDYDPQRPFAAWLRGIARTTLKAKRREWASSPCVGDDLLWQLEERVDALDQAQGDSMNEKLSVLSKCIAGLSERDRTAIECRYEAGLRGAGLAERLQTSLENARKTVQRARARVLRCMQASLVWE